MQIVVMDSFPNEIRGIASPDNSGKQEAASRYVDDRSEQGAGGSCGRIVQACVIYRPNPRTRAVEFPDQFREKAASIPSFGRKLLIIELTRVAVPRRLG